MWETRLARREALHAIAGRGTILAMFLLLVISMLIGWFIGGRQRVTTRVGDLNRHAKRGRRALCGALLLSRDQRLHDPYCLSILDGSRQSAFSPGLRGMAQTAAYGGSGIDCIKTGTGQWPEIGRFARPGNLS